LPQSTRVKLTNGCEDWASAQSRAIRFVGGWPFFSVLPNGVVTSLKIQLRTLSAQKSARRRLRFFPSAKRRGFSSVPILKRCRFGQSGHLPVCVGLRLSG